MKRVIALVLIASLSVALIWQRSTQAEARAALRQEVSHCVKEGLQPAQRVQVCAQLLEVPDLSEPAQASFHYATGWAYKDQEKYAEAADAYSRAMALRTKRIYFSQRSYVLLQQGLYEEGLADAQSGIDLRPDAYDARHKVMAGNVAWAYRKLKEPEKELAALDRYLTIWPDDEKQLKRRVRAVRAERWQIGFQEAALMELRDLSHLFHLGEKKNWNPLRSRIELLKQIGLTEHALRDGVLGFETLLVHGDPETGEALDEQGRADLAEILKGTRESLAAAQDRLTARVDRHASDWDGIRARANVQYQRGRIGAAIADIRLLIEMRPEDENAQEELVFLSELQVVLEQAGLALE